MNTALAIFYRGAEPDCRVRTLEAVIAKHILHTGISYLYGPDREEIAMTEARPWLGSLISVAQFKHVADIEAGRLQTILE